MMNESDRQTEFEREMSEALTEGDMQKQNREDAVKRRLSPRYEIRMEAPLDPIVEETKIYRGMAKEIDDRYDKYISGRRRGKSISKKTDV